MQHSYKSIALPSTEYNRLQRLMLTMIGSRTVLASILRRKLGSAAPVSSLAVASDVAIGGREVVFKVDGEHSERRVLTWQPPMLANNSALSLLSPRGLALLGLSSGDSIAYNTDGGGTEFLQVESVAESLVQPSKSRVARIKAPRPQAISDGIPVHASARLLSGGLNA